MAIGYSLLAARAPGHPHANRLLRRVRRHHRGEAIALQDVERVQDPGRSSSPQWQVLVECVELSRGSLAGGLDSPCASPGSAEAFAGECGAADRPTTVPPEVHLRPNLERHEDLVQLLELLGRWLGVGVPRRRPDAAMAAALREPLGDAWARVRNRRTRSLSRSGACSRNALRRDPAQS